MEASDSWVSAANSSKAFNAQSGKSPSGIGWSKFGPAVLTRVCSRWPEAITREARCDPSRGLRPGWTNRNAMSMQDGPERGKAGFGRRARHSLPGVMW